MKYKGLSIADLLASTVEDAVPILENIPQINAKLRTLHDVGLGYIHLGQSSTTLSGGEAQRIKLARELSKRQTGRTLYILDEPTTGLHFEDVRRLLDVLQRLVDLGNTVIVIEHQLDVIKSADWIIDMGPEGGEARRKRGGGRNAGADSAIQEKPHRAGAGESAALRKSGMSKYAQQPLSFQGLKTVPIQARGGKVRVEHFAKPYAGGGIAGVARFASAHPGGRFAALGGGRAGRRARPQENDPLGTGRPRDQVRPGADSDRSDAARLRDSVRA